MAVHKDYLLCLYFSEKRGSNIFHFNQIRNMKPTHAFHLAAIPDIIGWPTHHSFPLPPINKNSKANSKAQASILI